MLLDFDPPESGLYIFIILSYLKFYTLSKNKYMNESPDILLILLKSNQYIILYSLLICCMDGKFVFNKLKKLK